MPEPGAPGAGRRERSPPTGPPAEPTATSPSRRPARGVAGWLAVRLPFYYGWIVVAVAFVTIAIGANSRTAFSLLFPPLLDETGWPRGLTAGIFSFGFLVSIPLSAGVGWLIDRLGPGFVMPVGAWTVAVGLILATAAAAPWHLYLTLGALAVGGSISLAFIGHGAFLPNWFSRRRGLAMGIAASGVGFGALPLFPWIQWIVDHYGWRESCWLLALFLLAIVLPLNLLLPRRDPSELGLEPEGGEAPEPGRPDDAAHTGSVDGRPPPARTGRTGRTGRTLRGALRDARYWFVWAGIFCALFAWYCIQVHQTRFLIDVGFSPATAAWALTLVGVTGIAGLIGIGHLSDRIGREWGWTAACGGYVVCYALLLVLERVPSAPLMYLMVASQGLLGYGIASLYGSVAADLFQGPRFGTIFGTLSLGAGLGAAAGPWVGGVVFDAGGSYAPAFVLGVLLSVVSAVCIWLAAPRKVRPVT